MHPGSIRLKIQFESRAPAYLTLDLDLASGIIHDPFYNVEADAASFHMVMKTLKHGEQLRYLIYIHPQAVVLDT